MGALALWFEASVRWRLPIVSLKEMPLGDHEYHYLISDQSGTEVGEFATTMLPSDAIIYVRGIRIKDGYLCRRFGTAAVFKLARLHRRQLVPVREAGTGQCFWPKLRKWGGISFLVGEKIERQELREVVASRCSEKFS